MFVKHSFTNLLLTVPLLRRA